MDNVIRLLNEKSQPELAPGKPPALGEKTGCISDQVFRSVLQINQITVERDNQ